MKTQKTRNTKLCTFLTVEADVEHCTEHSDPVSDKGFLNPYPANMENTVSS